MLNWLQPTWYILRTSLWLLPASMTIAGAALAFALLHVDAGFGSEDLVRAWWMNGGSGDDARNLLSTLVAAIITMASMVFSVTVVALTLAANAYGPRLIRIFRADLRTQVVLGLFVMTIVYCLLVLRSVRGQSPPAEVPHVSVTVGTGLSLVCVLALLAFIHQVARLIVADEVVQRARRDLEDAIAALPGLGDTSRNTDNDSRVPSGPPQQEVTRIELPREGYVQAVDYDGMVRWAERQGMVVWLDFRPGDYAVEGDHRIAVQPRTSDPAGVKKALERYIVSGEERTPTQDIEFSMRHLVEVAVRALSPGVNDPYTATVVIDRLRGSMSRLMARRPPAAVLSDVNGIKRLYRPAMTYGRVLDRAFNQIRHAGSQHPIVIFHLLEALARIADHTRSSPQRAELMRHARLARDAALRHMEEEAALEAVERAYAKVVQTCEVLDQQPSGG